jgi:hypothetical protein
VGRRISFFVLHLPPQTVRRLLAALLPLNVGVSGEVDLLIYSSSFSPNRSAGAGGVPSPQCWGRWGWIHVLASLPPPQTVRRLLAALLPLNVGVSGEVDFLIYSSSFSPNRSAGAGGVPSPQCWGRWGWIHVLASLPPPQTVRRLLAALLPLHVGVCGEGDVLVPTLTSQNVRRSLEAFPSSKMGGWGHKVLFWTYLNRV